MRKGLSWSVSQSGRDPLVQVSIPRELLCILQSPASMLSPSQALPRCLDQASPVLSLVPALRSGRRVCGRINAGIILHGDKEGVERSHLGLIQQEDIGWEFELDLLKAMLGVNPRLDLFCPPRVLAAETPSQQERLQAIAEKRRRQAEIENRRRQLEDDRRQLQHLKSKALRERWLLEGTPSSASEGDEDMRRQMQEDEQKARHLEESISRLEQEIEELENTDALPTAAARGSVPAPSPAPGPAPSPAPEDQRAEAVPNSPQTPVGTPKEKQISNTPLRTVDGSTMMKAAMYSVEITVEKDKVTGETRVLSSTTVLPRELLPQGIKVYEDETKVVHAMDGTAENGIHPLSSSEVDELIHKADEVTLNEAGSVVGAVETRGPSEEAVRTTPSRREITGVQAQPGEATSGPPGIQPGQEPPVTMIFMGYQNVEDEAETQKVLGLQDTITAELVVIEDAAEPKEPAPPNGSAAEPPATESSREENQVGPEAPATEPQDLDMKKQRCKCCSIM
uniref:Paralemmin-1 n=2 Tax=Capra hircus TaxID=9925 RepID=A0A8C2S6K1_CAPHI